MNKLNPTFEEAMNASMHWCNAWEQGELSDEVLADRVSELLTNRDGARGFFVISLASDCPLMDRIPDPLMINLRIAGKMIVDLTARNLAMSSAMTVHHQRQNNIDQRIGSERVKSRCIDLLRLLETSQVKERLEKLLAGTKGEGEDSRFIKVWGYDNEQKLAIAKSIYCVSTK